MEALIAKRTAFPKYPAYKDSGVEWLGEIPESWELSKLGRLLDSRSVKNMAHLPLLSITRELGVIERDMENDEDNHNFIPDDLSGYKLLREGQFGMNKMKAWQGSYGISPLTGIVSPAYYVFDLRNVDPRFFHWAIRSKNYVAFFGRASDGVRIGQWDLSKSRMKEIPFFIPPKSEQTTIARFLDEKTAKIDKAIAQKERLIALLKERKQIIIQQAVTKGINPNAKMKDSGVSSIGQIPKNWTVKKLKYLLKSQGRIGFKGYTTSDLVDEGEGALTLGASHMDWDGNLKLTDRVYISWKKYYESPEIMVSRGDIVIVQRGSTCGKVALIDCDLGPMTINPSLILLKKINDNSHFVLEAIKVVLGEILNLVSNTAIPMISQFQVDNIEIALPNRQEQDAIINYVHSKSNLFVASIQLQEKQIEKLKEYRSVLIDSAVTGKIKVG